MSLSRDLPADIFQMLPVPCEPIYRQMIEQLRRLVVGGQVNAGDGMPSVREVAGSLGVNPATVSKAYSMLEAEGLLERRRGMGMIIAKLGTRKRTPAVAMKRNLSCYDRVCKSFIFGSPTITVGTGICH